MAIYSIYTFTNLVNGKIYVGQTEREPSKRLDEHIKNAQRGSKNALYAAIRKYGIDQFSFNVICSTTTKINANHLEVQFIRDFNCCTLDLDSHGYNMTRGGDGFDSDFNKQRTAKRLQEGTHPFQGEAGSALQRRLIDDGINPLHGENGRALQRRRFEDGTHHLLDPKYPEKARRRELQKVQDGLHPFAGERGSESAKRIAAKRLSAGTHNLMGENGRKRHQEQIASGTHPSQRLHVCDVCQKQGKGNYFKGKHFSNCLSS